MQIKSVFFLFANILWNIEIYACALTVFTQLS